MKRLKSFKLLFKYLNGEKLKLFIYVILSVIMYTQNFISVWLWANAVEFIMNGNIKNFILTIVINITYTLFVWVLIQFPSTLLYNSIEKNFMANINKALYKRVSNLEVKEFEKHGVGEYINRMYTDPFDIFMLIEDLIRVTCDLSISIFVLLVAFKISIYVFIELIVLCIIMYIFSNIYYPKISSLQENIREERDNYVRSITENLTGIREIKGLGIKDTLYNKVINNINNIIHNEKKIGVNQAIYFSLCNLSFFVIQFIILLTLGIGVYKNTISIVEFLILEQFIWKVDNTIRSLSSFGININKIGVSINRIDELFNNSIFKEESFGNKHISTNKDISIKFNKVYFKYNSNESNILKGLDLTIPSNKKIGIVGKSGNGKTTIFNLLLRYFDTTKGSIKINNINIKDLDEDSLRNTISIVRQDPFIFNMSIIDNLRLVKDASIDEIRDVCKKAYIDDYIMSLPDKYNTIIGEGGVNLSGGEKQRLAIARVLLKDTKVILFDEATSALDNLSQEYIKKTINELRKNHTIIVVAHRLTTIEDSDEIVIIEDGKVNNKGTHKYLMSNSSLYKELYNEEIKEQEK